MEDSTRRATANKRLHVNQRVSGAVGDHLQGPTKRRCHQRLYRHNISAAGKKKYLVRFDDGSKKECFSVLLRVEKIHASLPIDVNLPIPAGNGHRVDVAEVEEGVADQEDEKPLAVSLDDEEMEAALEDAECKGGNPPNATTEGVNPPNGMPGNCLPNGSSRWQNIT
jgi:hypothetical protein